VSLPMTRVTRSTMDSFKQILGAHPGTSQVWFKMVNSHHTKTFQLADKVTASLELISDLKALLGASCVELGGSA
jgi:DNA polymerase-3 subunit alpha